MLNEIAVVGGEDMESDGMSGVEMNRVDGGNGAAQRNGARRQLDVDDLGGRNAGEGGITMTPNYRKLWNNRRKKLDIITSCRSILFLSLTGFQVREGIKHWRKLNEDNAQKMEIFRNII